MIWLHFVSEPSYPEKQVAHFLFCCLLRPVRVVSEPKYHKLPYESAFCVFAYKWVVLVSKNAKKWKRGASTYNCQDTSSTNSPKIKVSRTTEMCQILSVLNMYCWSVCKNPVDAGHHFPGFTLSIGWMQWDSRVDTNNHPVTAVAIVTVQSALQSMASFSQVDSG